MSYKDTIQKKFWHESEPTPVAYTVGGLIDILKELPSELDIRSSFSEGVMVVVYNIDRVNMHVEIVEVD